MNHSSLPQQAQSAADRALAGARRNALRRLVRCLFAEKIIDPARLVFAPRERGAWLPLWPRQALLHFEDLWLAPAATFVNRGAIELVKADASRTPIDEPGQLIDVLREHFDFAPGDAGVERLRADMANSVANDALARVHRAGWNAELADAIASSGAAGLFDLVRRQYSVRDGAVLLDQWGALEGHPFYPTWKTKPDLNPEEVARLSPEFNARVNVRVGALRGDMAYIERMPHVASYHEWFASHFPAIWEDWTAGLRARDLDPAAWLPLPIHEWQLAHYVPQEYAAEIAEGLLLLEGPDVPTWPTMSFRTMMPLAPGDAPFIKLPLALWLTSEQRSLQAKSIHMGPRISTVIQRILADEGGFGGKLAIFTEEVALHYRHAEKREDRPGRHLSVAYRASRAAFERDDGLLPVTVAALLTEAPDGRPLVAELVGEGDVTAWFRRYAHVVTQPVVAIYLLYGIALEAHQQNTSVLFGADGQPESLLIRDFGDGRTYAPLLAARGHTLQPYVHPGILPTVFDGDIGPVRAFVIDACLVCHLHELALLLTRAYGLADERLWRVLRDELAAAFDAVEQRVDPAFWQAERAAFLEQPWPTRSVLRMHLQQYADYRLTHELQNPLTEPPTEPLAQAGTAA
ncbi:IucA/IucC family protein [Pseudoduganella chitinolytica]|uniref:IucA/IucC family protein n=1 Tax=Pseudoduganella chitinolytica TaxID=34070 RepID=A0ABY8BED8_9BURK|nr:IucA/IucC family protein [Pseudoduganella chitinolytica]WEF34276.1 IucA/IucC family protein [Pseudoduganella chitinolytica]